MSDAVAALSGGKDLADEERATSAAFVTVRPQAERSRELLRQVGRILELAPDWDGEEADPVDLGAADRATKFIGQIEGIDWLPHVAPTTDGGVRLEWENGEYYMFIDFEPDDHTTVVCEIPSREGPVIWVDGEIPADISFVYEEVLRTRR